MTTFRNLLCSFFLLSISLTSLSAQTDLKLRPLGFFLGNYNISIDQAITPKFSFEASGLLYRNAVRFNLTDIDPIDSGFGILAIGKIYFSKYANDASDFYTGPYFFYKKLNSSQGGSLQRGALGWNIGYKAVFQSKFILETDFGLGRALYSQATDNYPVSVEEDNILANLDAYYRISIGYRIGG